MLDQLLDCYHPASAPLRLLVAVHNRISEADLEEITERVWANALIDIRSSVFLPARYATWYIAKLKKDLIQFMDSFLLMLAAEKLPDLLSQIVKASLQHATRHDRRKAALRLVNLFLVRRNILTLPLADSSRRPFRAGRQQISFVPTAIGTPSYQSKASEEDGASFGSALPAELRRALLGLGWNATGDQETSISERHSVPLSLLPQSHIQHELSQDTGSDKLKAAVPTLLRRKSSVGSDTSIGHSVRPVLVPSLAKLMLDLVDTYMDTDETVRFGGTNALLVFRT